MRGREKRVKRREGGRGEIQRRGRGGFIICYARTYREVLLKKRTGCKYEGMTISMKVNTYAPQRVSVELDDEWEHEQDE